MINRLLLFFALVYVVEGVGQVEGLIAQPLSFYLKEVHGWTAFEVSAYLTIFNFPWIIKPLYGAFSDFVPLLGYRRKSYLLAANIVAAGAFLALGLLGAVIGLFDAWWDKTPPRRTCQEKLAARGATARDRLRDCRGSRAGGRLTCRFACRAAAV